MRKKLIEVALPLDAINTESAREKSIRHGHPSTLHLWWARRPLAACRAVLWASLVDDPSSWPDKFPTEAEQNKERQRLFDILGRIELIPDKKGGTKEVVRGLVSWDDIKQPEIIADAQREIARCLAWERGEEPPKQRDKVREYIAKYAPPVYDPFAGGGSIPLEAQRLGLQAHASDLNPVAVLINKALIEIPPKFKNLPPINPDDHKRVKLESWKGAQGLAADVRYYGQWMRNQAFEQIGHLYPKVKIPPAPLTKGGDSSAPLTKGGDSSAPLTKGGDSSAPLTKGGWGDSSGETGGTEATVIAWLWARTVVCPNPACGCQMPLVRSFQLSTKKGKEAWVEPIPPTPLGKGGEEAGAMKIQFEVKTGTGEAPEGTVERKGARCLACQTPVGLDHVRSEGKAGRMGQQLMAIVAEGKSGRIYLPPNQEHIEISQSAQPSWKPDTDLPEEALGFRVQNYGMTKHADLFTPRQLVALTTFSDLVGEARDKAIQDARYAGLPDDDVPLDNGGTGARAYGEAVATYLGLGVSKLSDYNSSNVTWSPSRDQSVHVFTKQAIAMVWDFTEVNIFAKAAGDILVTLRGMTEAIEKLDFLSKTSSSLQKDATQITNHNQLFVISTDPPYYDAVPYADLSDFFYVWLRRSIGSIYPEICNTVLVPKSQELVADMFRHGSREKAKEFFENGLSKVFHRINQINHHDYPVTVYYALKQTETDDNDNVSSTGWETMLEGLMQANFSIGGTWPLQTERSSRMRSIDSNALSSSIVLVCRPRPEDAPKTTRRQFLPELRRKLTEAVKILQQGNIAPVDLAQASIGPGMGVYSQYAAILETDGTTMSVRTALQLVNQILDEYLAEQEGEFDSDTRWALAWFEQHQFNPGLYGDAETLSKAKNTSISGLVEAGILEAKAGKVRLLPRGELKSDWNPEQDNRTPDWEVTQYLIRELIENGGEVAAAELLGKLGGRGEVAKDLAYRLYSICDRKGWAKEALAYNSLVISWPEISRLAEADQAQPVQGSLGF